MCEPASIAMGISAGVGALTSAVGGYTSYQQGQASAKVARNNAALASAQAEREAEQGEKQRGRQSMKNAQLRGAQIARGSAAGFDVWGADTSVQDLLGDTAYFGAGDIAEMYNATAYRINDLQNEAISYKNQDKAYKSAGKNALLGGMLGAGASLAGGVSDVYKNWAAANPAKTIDQFTMPGFGLSTPDNDWTKRLYGK